VGPRIIDFEERLSALSSAKFQQLRPGQQLVLQEYAARHRLTRDLAIEMPTGEGKTLVALLIADLALDEGKSVAYLTGTRQLAEHVEHVEQEAIELGIDIVRFSGKRYGGKALDDYHQAQAVAVMNYWVYFNSSPVPKPADLVIFDDAHLAEQPLAGLQTVRIPHGRGAAGHLYQTVCDLVLAHTDAYTGLWAMRAMEPRCQTHRRNCSHSATGPQSQAQQPTPSKTRHKRKKTRSGTPGERSATGSPGAAC